MKKKYAACAGALVLASAAVEVRAQTIVDGSPPEIIVTAARPSRSSPAFGSV